VSQPLETNYAPINGLDIYFEIHGAGDPLILLHGGIAASEVFGENLTLLATTRKVVVVHLQGHGNTKDIDRPFRFEFMADDVAALIQHLGFEHADVLGYSMGAGVALQVAIRHSELVRKLVLVSIAYRPDGYYPEVRAAFEEMASLAPVIAEDVAKSPLAELYPHVDWETSFVKSADMETQPNDWDEGAAGITAQTMLVFADADCIRMEHIVDFYKVLGGGRRDAGIDGSLRSPNRLAIIPGATHYNILSTPTVAQFTAAFLEA
jgi:pimeloyl-ACP methyl ester carboxylesterase